MRIEIISYCIIVITGLSCNEIDSDCYANRNVRDQIESVVKLIHLNDTLMVDSKGTRYNACAYPKNLTINQNYEVRLDIYEILEFEKLLGIPCKILEIETQLEQEFDLIGIGVSAVFTGGGESSDSNVQRVIGVDLKRNSQQEFQYQYTVLDNWKKVEIISGDLELAKGTNYKIAVREGKFESAFKLIDSISKIEILVTKEIDLNNAKIRLRLPNGSFTNLMYSK